jgi:hypothetical protein
MPSDFHWETARLPLRSSILTCPAKIIRVGVMQGTVTSAATVAMASDHVSCDGGRQEARRQSVLLLFYAIAHDTPLEWLLIM